MIRRALDHAEAPNASMPDVDPCRCTLHEEHLDRCRPRLAAQLQLGILAHGLAAREVRL
jgi:hypothetical protein